MFKEGDKVVCINDNSILNSYNEWTNKPVRIKFGGQYVVYREADNDSYELVGISGVCYAGIRFVSVSEYRKMIIKNIKNV